MLEIRSEDERGKNKAQDGQRSPEGFSVVRVVSRGLNKGTGNAANIFPSIYKCDYRGTLGSGSRNRA